MAVEQWLRRVDLPSFIEPYRDLIAAVAPTVLVIAVLLGTVVTGVAYLILVERWVAAAVQNRHGPNRVGPWGLLQPLVDGLKPLLKEEVFPRQADKFLFLLAPGLAALTTLLGFAVVPFGPTGVNEAADRTQPLSFAVAPAVDIGLLYIFATGSLAVYAVILGGWSSNNKYGMLGALRSSAQVISYEIPLGLSILGVLLFYGTLNLDKLQVEQASGPLLFGWNVWYHPLPFLMFMTSALAEANRLPFDLPECEQELVAGYHTEYSGLKFAFFMLAEYIHMIAVSFLLALLFLGGWHFPVVAAPASDYPFAWLVKCGVLSAKVLTLVMFFMFIRQTLPRFRFDQLMSLAWKGLIPLSLAYLLVATVVRFYDLPMWVMLPVSLGLLVGAAAVNARRAQLQAARWGAADRRARPPGPLFPTQPAGGALVGGVSRAY